MDQPKEVGHVWALSHEYPDPDSAIHATAYPWVRDADGDFLNAQPEQAPGSLSGADSSTEDEHAHNDFGLGAFRREQNFGVDSDYQVSDNVVSEDENISDEGSEESVRPVRERHPSMIARHELLSIQPISPRSDAVTRGRGTRGRGLRCSQIGRGGRGIKRGLRKPIEPGVEFKAHLSEATMAFTQSDLDRAELSTLRALKLNPEMFQAHNLLSQIHAARGEKDKALLAAWNGAHTRPRDTSMWARIASLTLEHEGENRESAIRDAIYCYARILAIDKLNVEARYQRATLNRELGHKGKVVADYEYLLRYLPHDSTVLRHLAEIYIELNDADQALRHYEETVSHYQAQEPRILSSFAWSDVNIIAELYWSSGRFDEGIVKLKNLARWLLGRKSEVYWDLVDKDDREWDFGDQPRRTDTPGFIAGSFDDVAYGEGLPLELRVKLGVFRLYSEKHDLIEAIAHFEWLDPEDNEPGAKLFDYPDLFREAANALRVKQHFDEALRYYEPLQEMTGFVDVSVLIETALCHRAVGSKAEAKECYKTVLAFDPASTEARVALWNMGKASENVVTIDTLEPAMIPAIKRKTKRPLSTKANRVRQGGMQSEHVNSSRTINASRVLPPIKKTGSVQHAWHEEDVQALYSRWKTLSYRRRDVKDKAAWFEAARLLLRTFLDNRVFYPADRHNRFYGYTKEARAIASKRKHERDSFTMISKFVLVTLDGDEIEIPDEYMGIPFVSWLEIFLDYSLELAKCGETKSAYEKIAGAIGANIFYHSRDALTSIHICWFTCALIANDEETLCNVARWFMTEYQFVTDAYHLYAALNRLADSRGGWYNCGPSQKYVLRQIKAMDYPFAGKNQAKGHFQERAAYTTKDSHGNLVQADSLDVALLMLYGHILYAGKSYACAVNYFLRALALDSTNAIIKLSLALGYIHWAIKRHAENRHYLLTQGFAFLMEYYDDRRSTGCVSHRQEAEFNVGRAYHLLGLTHLAIPYYENCLEFRQEIRGESTSTEVDDFAMEAALTLQGHWAASGDVDRAREVTDRWLWI